MTAAWHAVNCREGLIHSAATKREVLAWLAGTHGDDDPTTTQGLRTYEYQAPERTSECSSGETYLIGRQADLTREGYGWAFETESD